jgi:hypothetical protein
VLLVSHSIIAVSQRQRKHPTQKRHILLVVIIVLVLVLLLVLVGRVES